MTSAIANQGADLQPKTVELVCRKSPEGQDNYTTAAFSFEHGMNGDASLKVTLNDWDILFGNGPTCDTFDVTTVTDDRSRISDLGPGDWSAIPVLHDLGAHPSPAREATVQAVVGHFYFVHTVDRETDLYALFRVDSLEPGKSVTISWIVVPPEWVADAEKSTR
jgi:hypothetical protein